MDATRTTPLRERMRQELQLAALSERTQEAYLRAVRQLGGMGWTDCSYPVTRLHP